MYRSQKKYKITEPPPSNLKFIEILGIYDLTKKKDEFKPYVCVMCCDHIDSMVSRKKGQKFDVHRGTQLEICNNFDNN